MKNIVQKIPFLRITIAFAIGVVIADNWISVNQSFIYPAIFLLLSLFVLNKFYNYRYSSFFGVGTSLLFICFGILSYINFNKKPIFNDSEIFEATFSEIPIEKKNTFQAILLCKNISNRESTDNRKEKVNVYFQKNALIQKFQPGDRIVFKAKPTIIENFGNPFEFDYKKYLNRKKIYRQVYLNSDGWIKIGKNTKFSLSVFAQQIREKLLLRYKRQVLDKKELEILSALTLGYKRNLNPETKRIFSSAGAMHVLAVSGLHVGIIYWLILLCFGILKKQKGGKIVFVSISICLLWLYAFITGLSPSVLRATTMLTIFIIGENLKRKTNTYNSLAASALIILLINPNNLFEVGFQLSYSAVFGIVFLQPKIAGLVIIENKIVLFFWNLFTVSLAAQIATFPLSCFYFGQFPLYFFISNMVIIPVVMVLIPLGLALLFLANVAWVSTLIAFALNLLLKSVIWTLSAIESLPFSVLNVSMDSTQLILILFSLALFFIFIKSLNVKHLKLVLSLLLILSVYNSFINLQNFNTNRILVYNSPQNPMVQLINRKSNYVITKKAIQESHNNLFLLNTTNRKLKLHAPIFLTQTDSYKNSDIFLRNGFLIFNNRKLIFNNSNFELLKSFSVDYFINTKPDKTLNKYYLDKAKHIQTFKAFEKNNAMSALIFNTSSQGYFSEKWKNTTLIQYVFGSE